MVKDAGVSIKGMPSILYPTAFLLEIFALKGTSTTLILNPWYDVWVGVFGFIACWIKSLLTSIKDALEHFLINLSNSWWLYVSLSDLLHFLQVLLFVFSSVINWCGFPSVKQYLVAIVSYCM